MKTVLLPYRRCLYRWKHYPSHIVKIPYSHL